jgi:hypothetical protein
VHAPCEAAEGTEPGSHEPMAFAEQELEVAPPEQSTGSAPDDDPPLPLPELEPLEDPDDEPDDEPLEDPEEDPDDEPLEDPDDEPLDDPEEDPDDEPLEDPDDEPLDDPDDEPLEEEPLPPPLPVPLLLPLPLALPSSTGVVPTIPPSEPTPTSSSPTSLPAAQAARTLAAAMPTKPTGRSQDTFMSHLHRCTRRGRRPDFLVRAYSPLNGMRHAQTPAALSIETRACENQCHRKRTLLPDSG